MCFLHAAPSVYERLEFCLSPPLHEHKTAVWKQLKTLENVLYDRENKDATSRYPNSTETAAKDNSDDGHGGGDDDEMTKELKDLINKTRAPENKSGILGGILGGFKSCHIC